MAKDNREITVPWLLKQYRMGAFTGGLVDVAMERLEELYNATQKPQVFIYEDGSVDDVAALKDRFMLVKYKKGTRPPTVV